MKKHKRYLYLNTEEITVVLHSLVQLKNKLIRQGRYRLRPRAYHQGYERTVKEIQNCITLFLHSRLFRKKSKRLFSCPYIAVHFKLRWRLNLCKGGKP